MRVSNKYAEKERKWTNGQCWFWVERVDEKGALFFYLFLILTVKRKKGKNGSRRGAKG